MRSTMTNSSNNRGSLPRALSGSAPCCDARQEHGLVTCSSETCVPTEQVHGLAIGISTDSVLKSLLLGTVSEAEALSILAEPVPHGSSCEAPNSILHSLLVGENVDGYSLPVVKEVSVLRSLLIGKRIEGYEPSIVPLPQKRIIKCKRPMHITVPIPRDPKSAKFPPPACKSGCDPRTAQAAKLINYQQKCDESWSSCHGVRARAAEAWEQRVVHGVKNEIKRFAPAQKYMKYGDNSRTVTRLTQPVYDHRSANVSTKNLETPVEEIPALKPKFSRVSKVTEEEVSYLREKGRQSNDLCRSSNDIKVKTWKQKLGWRFVKNFRDQNRGIIWTHAKWRTNDEK